MKKLIRSFLFISSLIISSLSFGQTSWTGITSSDWSDATNWTNGIPNTTVDVTIGDASFTGVNQPTLSSNSACNSLTLGNGSIVSSITFFKNNLAIAGNLTIGANGTVNQKKATLSVNGNWINNGSYSISGQGSVLIFGGVAQTVSGNNSSFQNLIINNGSVVTLMTDISVGTLTVSGTINPNESPTHLITSGSITVNPTGLLKVYGSTFSSNYSSIPSFGNNSTVEYASTTVAQTIDNTITYHNLKISGTTTKTLGGNLPALSNSSSTDGTIYVSASTLDLSTFTANRIASGGSFTVSNGATVKIGGTGTFPANYATYSLSLGSYVEYNGLAQVITPITYGNLKLSSSSGSVTKSSSGTAFTVSGNFTTNIGNGTGVTYTSTENITISGNDTLGANTTFNAGSYIDSVGGNFYNLGTYTATSGSINFTGPGSSISGSGTFNFNDIIFSASLITGSATSNFSVAGNITTTNAGMFTHNSGGAITMSGTSKVISGANIVLSDLTVSGTITTSSSINIWGSLTVAGSFIASNDILIMAGSNKTISGGGTITFSQLSILGTITTSSNINISNALDVSSSGSSFLATSGITTFTGSSTLNGTVNLFSVTLNGTSLKLSTNSILGIANNYLIASGTLNCTTSFPNTVLFNGTVNQNVPTSTFYNLSLYGSTKTATGGLIINGNLTILSSATLNASTFTHSLYNNFIKNGSFIPATSNFQFIGTKDASITGTDTFNILTINKANSGNVVTMLNDVTASTVAMTTGILKAGTHTITMTSNRTGNGIITGIIRHLHSFSTGVDYAFESPYNKINFTALSGVTSITETVTLGLIQDYPYISAIYREYDFSIPVGTYTASVYLHYENSELAGNNKATMQFWGNNGPGWTQLSKTGYDATNNYVYTDGITNIQPRYTLCSVNSVYRWTGKTNTDWNNAGNWSYVQGGNPQGLPGSTDVVLIGDTTFTRQPIVSQNDSAKTILFYATTPSTLTVATGGTLTTGGNILGNYTAGNATHNINIGNQNLVVNGNLVLSDGTSNHAINITSGSGNVTVGQSLTQTGGANLSFTSGNISVYGDYNYTSGTFNPGSGTFTFNGVQTQIVPGVTYNNVVINKATGTADANVGTPVINGSLTLTSGEFTFDVNTSVGGTTTIGSGTIMNGGLATLSVGGDWVQNGTFSSASSTVNFNGAGSQAISSTTFNNLIFNKASGTATLSGNLSMEGDLTITAGTVDLVSYTANRTSPGGTFSMGAGSTLLLASNNLPSVYTSYSLNNTSLVNYNGSGVQSVSAISYGGLSFTNGGSNVKSLSGLITVNGDITINSGATVDGAGFTISAGGNWVNNGTFTASSGTVLLNGRSNSISGSSVTNFFSLTVYGTYTSTGSGIITTGKITVATGGTLDMGSTPLTVSGDYTNSGTSKSNGTLTFTGTVQQNIRVLNAVVSQSTGIVNFNGTIAPILNSNTNTSFYTVNINNTGAGGINPSTDWTVAKALNVANGAIWNGGNHVHTILGSVTNSGTVTSTGTLNFQSTPSFTQTLTFGSSFTSTGTVIFGGSVSPTLVGTPTSLYDVTVSNTAGVTPPGNWTVNRNFTITSTGIFNAGSYTYNVNGDLTSNGYLNGNTSTFNLKSDTAILSGSANTNFNNLVIANNTAAGKITASSDFNVQGNFTNNGRLDVTAGTLRFTGSTNSIISGTSALDSLSQIDINKSAASATVTLAIPVNSIDNLDIISGTLDAATFGLNQDVLGAGVGRLYVRANATLKLGGTSSLPTFSISQLDSLSTIWYYGSGQTIASRIQPTPYGNLTISGSGTSTAAGPVNIRNNFTFSVGTLTNNNYPDTIGGNLSMISGTFTAGNSTVILNGSGTQDVNSSGPVNNLTISKSGGSVTTSSDLIVSGVLNFIKGIITTGSRQVIFLNTSSVLGASQSTGWVNGRFQKPFATSTTTKTFEIGDASSYTSVVFSSAVVGVAGTMTASTSTPDHPNIATSTINSNNSVNRYYTLTNNGIVFTTPPAVTFNWVASDVDAGSTPTNFGIGLYNGTAWSYPTFSNASSLSIKGTNISSFGDFAIGELVTSYVWLGTGGTNWFLNTNWNPATIPGVNSNVSINAAGVTNFPTITGSTLAKVNNLTIGAGASLTVTSDTLQISGTISNSGTFNASAGSIILNGKSAQTIPIGTFATKQVNNLIISNTSTSGVTLVDSIGILNALSFGNVNNAVLNTGGVLVIKSNATNTGRIADATNTGIYSPANSGNTIIGNVTVERYIPANNMRGYRFIASSVNSTGTIHANWQEGATSRNDNPHPGYGTHITGTTTDQANGFDGTKTAQSSFYRYDVASNSFIAYPNTNVLTLKDTAAYLLYFRGDRSINLDLNVEGSTNTTLRATGTIVQGSRIFSNSMVGNTNANGGFNLVTNPYASPISWTKIFSGNTGITKYFTYFDPKINGGSYITVDNAGSSNPTSTATVDIQSGEAFFIQASTSAAPTLTILESHKSTSNNVTVFTAQQAPQNLYTSLFIDDNLGRRNADAVVNRFDASYNQDIDGDDADDLENFNENISINRSTHHLAIEARPLPIQKPDTMFIYMSNMNIKNYDFQFNMQNLNGSLKNAFLVDRFTGSKTNISFDTATIIPFNVTNNPLSSDTGRFYIVLNPAVTLPVTLRSFSGIRKDNGVALQWETSKELDLKEYVIEHSVPGGSFAAIGIQPAKGISLYNYFDADPIDGDNLYRLKMTDKTGDFTYSNIVNVHLSSTIASVAVYPNPVVANTVHLQLNNLEKGMYHLTIVDKLGQIVYSTDINHLRGSELKTIVLDRNISKGVYQLVIGSYSIPIIFQ